MDLGPPKTGNMARIICSGYSVGNSPFVSTYACRKSKYMLIKRGPVAPCMGERDYHPSDSILVHGGEIHRCSMLDSTYTCSDPDIKFWCCMCYPGNTSSIVLQELLRQTRVLLRKSRIEQEEMMQGVMDDATNDYGLMDRM